MGLFKRKEREPAGLGRSVGPSPDGLPDSSAEIIEIPIGSHEGSGPGGKAKGKKKLGKSKSAKKDMANAQMQQRLSARVLLDSLPGFTKNDAIEQARHFAMSICETPSNAFFYIEKVSDGWMIEVQDGVGYAYLPSAIKLAKDNPGRTIAIPMLRRFHTLHYTTRTDSFDAQVLPEGDEPEDPLGGEPLYAQRGPSMTPVMKQYKEWLVTGIGTAAVGAVALVAALGFYVMDPETQIPPEWRTTNTSSLPIMQWDELMEGDASSYVVRMEFVNGQWRTVRQSSDAVVETAAADVGTAATILPSPGSVPPPAAAPAPLPPPTAPLN